MKTSDIVCVDLDGTLAYYDGWKGETVIGDPRPGAKEFVAALRERFWVVLYTTRCNPDPFGTGQQRSTAEAVEYIKAWLDKHSIVVDEVYVGPGKPMASAYIDDRAVAIRSNPGTSDFGKVLQETVDLIERLSH